jgi:hypothetical protein
LSSTSGSFLAHRPIQKPNIPKMNEQNVSETMTQTVIVTLIPLDEKSLALIGGARFLFATWKMQ